MFFARSLGRRRQRQTLILHIGMGKTGTTAIQESLWQNRKYLLSNGYRYPTAASISSAHHLISPHRPSVLLDNGWVFLDPQQWLPQVRREADRKVIMSTELIFWAEPFAIESFCREVSQAFSLHVCVYLRRQDLAIMAGYNQRIKVGQQVRPLAEELPDLIEKYNYEKLLLPWAEAIGTANIFVFPYEQQQMVGGNAVTDFYKKVLHIDAPDPPGAIGDANPGLSSTALEFKRCLNSVIPCRKQAAPFDHALRLFSALSHAPKHSTLSDRDRQHILARFHHSNRSVARTYLGPESQLFLDTSTDLDAALPAPGTEKLTIWEFLHQEYPDLLARTNVFAQAALASPDEVVREAAQLLLRMSNCSRP